METGNSGIIGVTETRTNINAMKDYYRQEYKKIVDKEKKSDSDLFHNKWKVRLGGFTARVGLIFQPPSTVKTLTRLGTRVVGFIAEKAMKLKNKIDKKNYEKEKDKLTADFINAEGVFSEFNINNETTIEDINEYEETEEKGFRR